MSIYYHAWHFAFRPAGGLDDGRLELLTRWVRKQQWHLLVTEGSGERRHAHVLIVIRSNLINTIYSVSVCHQRSGCHGLDAVS